MKKEKTFFGKQLKKIIIEKGISQQDFAAKLGVGKAMISQWITGTRNPSLTSLKKIAQTLNISLNYFLENEQNSETKINGLDEKDIKIILLEKEVAVLQKENMELKEMLTNSERKH